MGEVIPGGDGDGVFTGHESYKQQESMTPKMKGSIVLFEISVVV